MADEEDPLAILDWLSQVYKSGQLRHLKPILPLLTLKGKPYGLDDYPPLESFFKLQMSARNVWKCARQVGKTMSLSARCTLLTAAIPDFSTLVIAPRFEQVKRISHNHVRPFIEHSVVRHLFKEKHCLDTVLQRDFNNRSRMFFSFALIDMERIRGIASDHNIYDEIQDFDIDFLPEIGQCMANSNWQFELFAGTPKTIDNALEELWMDSSQAEWIIKCDACGHWNTPGGNYDLKKMIGLKGPVCVKCDALVNPRKGHFRHAYPERRWVSEGHHVPQPIMPLHFEDPDHPGQRPERASRRWSLLLRRMDGKEGFSEAKAMNEILGESCDTGMKILNIGDLKRASTLNRNVYEEARRVVKNYNFRIMGVDWGGGGDDGLSITKIAILGRNLQTGKLENFFGYSFGPGRGHEIEAAEILKFMKIYQCHYLAHDFAGAGGVRETLLRQGGLSHEKIMPFHYVTHHATHLIRKVRATDLRPRPYMSLNKSISLWVTALSIRHGELFLPEYESSRDLTHDWLNLVEDLMTKATGGTVMRIIRKPKMSDDYAHAMNYAAMGAWLKTNSFPDLANSIIHTLVDDGELTGPSPYDWSDGHQY